jgi:GR25 family glycosyltransferase involved in LPS biosynthesis
MIPLLNVGVLVGAVILATFLILNQPMMMQEGWIGSGAFSLQSSLSDMAVYVINLDRNKDRLQHFMKQIKKTDLKHLTLQRMPGVDGRTLALKPPLLTDKAMQEIFSAERYGYRTKHYQLSRGAVGCYLSHLKVYKDFLNSNRTHLLVFEDDAVFGTPHVLKTLRERVRIMPKGWDVVLLGCHCITCRQASAVHRTVNRFILMHAMLLTRRGAERILQALDEQPISQQIDTALSMLIQQGKLTVQCLHPPLVKQGGGFPTTIQIPLKKVEGVNPYAYA